jgi:hypothetical protein
MLIPALFLILMVGWVLDRLFIEEIENKQDLKKKLLVVRRTTVAGQGETA